MVPSICAPSSGAAWWRSTGSSLSESMVWKGLDQRQRQRGAHRQQQRAAHAVAHQRVLHGFDGILGLVLGLGIGDAQQPRAQAGVLVNDLDNFVHVGVLPGDELGQPRGAFGLGRKAVTPRQFHDSWLRRP